MLLYLCPTNLDIVYFHFHLFQCIFWFILELHVWAMNYLVYCLDFKCLEIFLLSFCYWFLVWFYCGQNLYSVWFPFNYLKIFLWHRIWSLLAYVLWTLGRNWIFCYCWVECCINVEQILLSDGAIIYILDDFLSGVLSIVDRGVLNSPPIVVDVCFFL